MASLPRTSSQLACESNLKPGVSWVVRHLLMSCMLTRVLSLICAIKPELKTSRARMVAVLFRIPLAVGGKGNYGDIIGSVGVRAWWAVRRGTTRVSLVRYESGSYHARASVTWCGLRRLGVLEKLTKITVESCV